MMSLDAAWVNTFVAVAEHLHFGRAAVALHVTQSTVSHRIRRLEETLEVELFDRSRRRVALTAAGRTFLRRAAPALADLARAVDDARASAVRATERLVVGYVGSLVSHPVVAALMEVARTFPDCAIEVQHRTTHDQIAAVRSGELDAGSSFVEPPPLTDDVEAAMAPPRPLWLWVAEEHPFADADHVDWGELAGERLVLLSNRAEPAFRSLQADLRGARPPIEVDALDIALAMVAEGIGITLLPEAALAVRGVRRVPTPLFTESLWMFWRRPAVSNPALQRLIDAFRRDRPSVDDRRP